MIKIKSISMVSACAAIILTSSPASAIITMDPGNIAGTIGIVANGATGIMQSIEIITNGSLLNSIIGDAAGTLYQFKSKFGIDLQKAIKLVEEAKKRVEEGAAAYNRYQDEVKQRQAQYQALMDKLNSFRGKEDYNDGSSSNAGNRNTNQSTSTSTTTPTTTPTTTNTNTTGSGAIRPYGGTDNDPSTKKIIDPSTKLPDSGTPVSGGTGVNAVPSSSIIRNEVSAQTNMGVGSYSSAETTQDDFGYHRRRFEPLSDDSITTDEPTDTLGTEDNYAIGSEVPTTETTQPTTNQSPFDRWLPNTEDTSSDITKPTTVFGADEPTSPVTPPTTTPTTPSGNNNSGSSGGSGHGDDPVPMDTPSTADPIEYRNEGPKGMDNKASYNLSSNLSYTSGQLFASETSDNSSNEIGSTQGVNYSAKGDFITPLAKRCGMSIENLIELDNMKACLTKVVAENNNKDMEYALNSRKDCQNMVLETIVALSAEATKAKNEASNYKDTLDEQEKIASSSETGSGTLRDDNGVHAMGNEQIQILLNRMSSMLSGEIIFEATNQLCSLSSNVFVENTEAEDDGQTSDSNSQSSGNGNTQSQNTEPENPDAEYEWFRDHSQSMTIDELNEYLKNGGKVGTNPYKNGGNGNSAQSSGNGATQPSGNNAGQSSGNSAAQPTVEAEPGPDDVAATQAKIHEESERIYNERFKGRTFVPEN